MLDFSQKTPMYAFLHQLYGNNPQALCCYDEHGHMLYCTKAYLHFLGSSSLEESQVNFSHFNPATQAEGQNSILLCQEHLAKALAEGVHTYSWEHLLKNGERVPVQYHLTRMEYQGIAIITCTLIGTSNHTKTLEDFYHQDKNIRSIVEASPLAVCLWNAEHALIDCNQSFMDLFGISTKEEYALSQHSFYPQNQQNGQSSSEHSSKLLHDAFALGKSDADWLWCNTQGETIPTYVSLRRVQYDGKDMVAEYIYDLRTLKESQNRATQAEIRNKIVLEAMPLSMSFWDKEYKLIDCNIASINLFGFKDKQEYMEKYNQVSPPYQPNGQESLPTLHKNFDEALTHGMSHVEWTHQLPDGTLVPVDKTCVGAVLHGEDAVITFSRDLREIKASQKVAAEAELRNKLMLESMPLGVHFWDNNLNLIDCNSESLKLYGFTSKEEFQANFTKTYPLLQPSGENSEDLLKACLQKALEEGSAYTEFLCLHQSQENAFLPVEMILTRISYKDSYGVITYIRDLRKLKTMLAEIQRVQDHLHEAKNIAEKNAAAKSEFLANMSHEIRTPMNGILGLLHLLNKTSLQAEQNSYVQKSLDSAQDLLRVINDMLDFSHMESGRFEFKEEPFALKDIIHDIEETFMAQAAEKCLTLHIENNLSSQRVLGDALRLKQVFFNLLDNAIKFTSHGSIHMCIHEKNVGSCQMQYSFSVKDTGIGIAPEYVEHIFSPFSQADTSFTRLYGGTGLGLVITQKIMQKLHGQIRVESQLDKGSTFYGTATLPMAEDASETQEKNLTMVNGVPAKLLLVEDNEINQMVAQEILEQVGYKVSIANNGLEALEMLEKESFDLVLMDIQMPIMDGLTAARKIREQEKFRSLPIVALSAHALEEDVQKSLAHGMNEHATKPINPKKLYKTIAYWIKNPPISA